MIVQPNSTSFNNISRESGEAIRQYVTKHLHLIELLFDERKMVNLSETGVTPDGSLDMKPISERMRFDIQQLLEANQRLSNVRNQFIQACRKPLRKILRFFNAKSFFLVVYSF